MNAIFGALRQPGRPLVPEHSVPLRVAAAGAVCTGIVACLVQGQLQGYVAGPAIALVLVGSKWSHARRTHPLPYLRVALAALMIGAFAWFFVTVSADAPAGALSAVVAALAVLFTVMQAAHSFDVPTRRDLGFSIAGSATLIALAATQAVSITFGALVAVWAGFVVIGLAAAWASMAGGARIRPATIAASALCALAVGTVVVMVLPPPAPPTFSPGVSGTPGGSGGVQLAHLVPTSAQQSRGAASASGPTGVGGYLGFAGPLDTALRASLGDQVVLRVRADRPTYWVAETYDTWSGQSWTESGPPGRAAGHASSGGASWETVADGPPFVVGPTTPPTPPSTPSPQSSAANGSGSLRATGGTEPRGASTGTAASTPRAGGAAGSGAATGSGGATGSGTLDYQTFYLATSGSNLVLHASGASAVWFPARKLFLASDGTIRSPRPLGAGSVYTVLSTVDTPSPAQLRAANGTSGLAPAVQAEDLQLPHAYPRVAALARRITAGTTTTYGAIGALEQWIGAHTAYTTDIPPLAPGQDSVDQFLFGSRRGYCEQISTALTVMLRTLGIPAREAVGYVPGSYDPITGTYDVEAKDAHAWVQVWFPGYGWQSFDPTAYVPAASPSSASSLRSEMVTALEQIPLVPTVPIVAVLACLAALVRWWRRRPGSWRAAVTRDIVRAARRCGAEAAPSATLGALAARVDAALGSNAARAGPVAAAAERAAWTGHDPDPESVRRLRRDGRRVRRAAARARACRILPRPGRRRLAARS